MNNQKPKEFLPQVIESAHSRFPVLGENDDEVLGTIKDPEAILHHI